MSLRLLLLLTLCLCCLYPASASAQKAQRFFSIVAGGEAPDYFTSTLQGDTLHLAQLRGELVLLNVWATWCPPCREELPQLQRLHEEFGSHGLRVVGVSLDTRSPRYVEGFLQKRAITYTNLRDRQSRMFRTFGFQKAVPQTLLIDRDGTVIGYWLGAIDNKREEAIRAMLSTLINRGS